MFFVQIITRASEAYGRMILETGLFQADGHPGNILVMKGGRVGLLDYGQSKQLADSDRLIVARLIVALTSCAPFMLRSVTQP
jgi:predicted unusual protein kinase regulating ubiquinone biosynthesis (AarF/ABC1/UbiB family)